MKKEMVWWRNHYAVSFVADNIVIGSDLSMGMKFLALDLRTGLPVEDQTLLQPRENFLVRKPLQYFHDTSHFETVKKYIQAQCGMTPVSVIEYLEFNNRIMVSFYTGEQDLANYLLVLTDDGQTLLFERIGEQLKGIGMDTFFMLSGYLIFAKNRRELVSYKMV
jgi:hypothetical protein